MSDNYSGLQQGTVRPLVPPPEAGAQALDRLYEAMVMAATIVRPAGDCFRLVLRLAIVSAPSGSHGVAVE